MENKKQIESFKTILRDTGLKTTIPRLAVLKVVSQVQHPMTARQIHRRLKKIDLVTLYRTLTSFEENQLVRRVDLHKDAVYYEVNSEHHHHIICTDCGKLENFEFCDVDRLTKKIIEKASYFNKISEHALELFGVCNACVKTQ
jgi:Fur family ferric uptake transcriptional regulator